MEDEYNRFITWRKRWRCWSLLYHVISVSLCAVINIESQTLIKAFVEGLSGQANSICALNGSSVALYCPSEHPTLNKKTWYTMHWEEYDLIQKKVSSNGERLAYNMSEETQPTLVIHHLRETDANIYCCRENSDTPQNCWSSGTKLQVAGTVVVRFIFRNNQCWGEINYM